MGEYINAWKEGGEEGREGRMGRHRRQTVKKDDRTKEEVASSMGRGTREASKRKGKREGGGREGGRDAFAKGYLL